MAITTSPWRTQLTDATAAAKRLADTASSSVTGHKLLDTYRANARNLVDKFNTLVTTINDPGATLDASEMQEIADLQKTIYDLLETTGASLVESQNFFVRLIWGRSCMSEQHSLLGKLLSNKGFVDGAYTARTKLDISAKKTDVAAHAKFDAVFKPDDLFDQRQPLPCSPPMTAPQTRALKAGNETPITTPRSPEEFDTLCTRCSAGRKIEFLPITEQTAKGVSNYIFTLPIPGNESFGHCLLGPPPDDFDVFCQALGVGDIKHFDDWPSEKKTRLFGLFNLLLSVASALPKNSPEFKQMGMLMVALASDGMRIPATPCDEAYHTYVDKTRDQPSSPKSAAPSLPDVGELFTSDPQSAQQCAIKEYKGMEFMQHARAKNIELFTGAIKEKFATYATNPDAMRHMQAVIKELPGTDRTKVLQELAEFADSLAGDIQTSSSPNKLNQLRAISELLLANKDDLPKQMQFTNLWNVSNAIVGKWDHTGGINSNEIASVVQIAALKKVFNANLSDEENKHLALLAANPRYGFCQRVYNTAAPETVSGNFHSTHNPNFRAYYGAENSLLSMDAFADIPAIANPSEFVTADALKSAIGYEVIVDKANGLILGTDGKLLVPTREKPPLIQTLSKPPADVAGSLDKRSAFKHDEQIIDGLVTINLTTGKATHKTAGEFVELSHSHSDYGNPYANFVAFKDSSGTVHVYSKTNFSNPVFQIRDGKFYSSRNPNIQLHHPNYKQCAELGIPYSGTNLCWIGFDNAGKIAEVVDFKLATLERGKSPALISFVRNEDSERLDLYVNGQQTDRYLVRFGASMPMSNEEGTPGVLKIHLPINGLPHSMLCTASDSNPRELALVDHINSDGNIPVIITLPEKRDGAIIFGRVKSDGEIEGATEAQALLRPYMRPDKLLHEKSGDIDIAKSRLRSYIACNRMGRSVNDNDEKKHFAEYKALWDAWKDAKESNLGSEYITLFAEAFLEATTTNDEAIKGQMDRTKRKEPNGLDNALNEAYRTLRALNPLSQTLAPFALWASCSDAGNIIPPAGRDRKFYKQEAARFKKQQKTKQLQDIRAHLPKPSNAKPTTIKRADLVRTPSAQTKKMAGADVRQEVFGKKGEPQFDLATVGAGALEILTGNAPSQSAPAASADAAAESDEAAGSDAPKSEHDRLAQHRKKRAEETQLYAEALWEGLAQHFEGKFDPAHPEELKLTDEKKGELQEKLTAAEGSLGHLDASGIPTDGDVRKVYDAYLRTTEAVENILTNVSANVKQMRLLGTLPMPKPEQLQGLLARCYDHTKGDINKEAFLKAYQQQFDPYATPERVEEIIGVIQDQMICKTALDASKARVKEFANFKQKIEQLINAPGAGGPGGKTEELKQQKVTLGTAREICQRYCAQEKARQTFERGKADLLETHAAAKSSAHAKIAENANQQADIQRQIDKFGEENSGLFGRGYAAGQKGGPYEINAAKINTRLNEINAGIVELNSQIDAAAARLGMARDKLTDDAVIIPGLVLDTKYKEVKAKLEKLRKEKGELDAAVSLKAEKEHLEATKVELEAGINEREAVFKKDLAVVNSHIDEAMAGKQKHFEEFTALQGAHADLLGDITLADDRLVPGTLDEAEILVLPDMEKLVIAKDQEIETQISDTKGRMLAVKEAYGSFIKSMAAARAYDANDMGNFFTMWFENQTGFRLRPDQVAMIEKLVAKIKSSHGSEQEVQALFQLMMGGGKTAIILSQMAQMLAGYGKIALFANHSSQHETMTKDLRKYQKDRYDQEVIEIDYPIMALRGGAGLKNLDEIQRQFEKAKQTGACITTQSTMLRGITLERRNAVIKIDECRKKLAGEADSAKKKEIRREMAELDVRLKKVEKLLSFIHENCAMICDEVDLNLDPTFSVNIPTGEKATFDPVQADCIRKFFKIIDGDSTVKAALRSGTGLDDATLGGVADKMLGELGVDKDSDQGKLYRQFVCYDDTPGVEHDGLEDQTFRAAWKEEQARLMNGDDADKELLEKLSMLRGLIGTERYASKKAFLESYGFRVDGQGEADVRKKTVKAVPYSAANTPSSGEYAHPIELAVYTHHAYLLADAPTFRDGSPLALKFESFIQKAIESPDSNEGKYLNTLIHGFAENAQAAKTATTPAEREELVEAAFKKLTTTYKGATGGDGNRNLLVAMLTASDFTFFPAMLEGTGYGQTHLTKLVIADSGTPWNAEILSAGFRKGAILDETTDMRILDKWEKDMAAGNSTVFQMQAENPTVATMLDGQAESHGNDGKATCALIDVAGSFKYLSNRQVAEQARDYYAARGEPFKGFAFFDTAKKSWFVLLSDPSKDPIELSNCAEGTILRETGINREDLFVYYDQNKTTGVDFKLPQSGRGLVTMEKGKTLLSRFLQGILRLRGFWDGQTADICQVDGKPDAAEALTEPAQHATRLCDLFGAARQNQSQLLGGRKVGAFVGQLTERKRRFLERAQQDYFRRHEWAIKHGDSPFVPSHWKRQYEKLCAAAAEAFTTDSKFSPSGWYASLKGPKGAAEHVEGTRQTMADSLAGFGLANEFLAATEDLAEQSKIQLRDMQTSVGGSPVELGTQVEQQTETEAEAEQQMEVSTSSMSGNDGDNVGHANRDQRYAPNAKLEAGVQMGRFTGKLLTGIASELSATEQMKALGLTPTIAKLAAADDLDKCRERFENDHILGTPKIPLAFFDALAQKAKDAGVETEVFVKLMYALQKDVDKIFKNPANNGSPNPAPDGILLYFGRMSLDASRVESPDLDAVYTLCDDDRIFDGLTDRMLERGLSLDQAKEFTAKLAACSAEIDRLAAAAEGVGEDAAEQPTENKLVSLQDLRTNPKSAENKLRAKLGVGNMFSLVKNGILPLLGIFTKNGKITVTDATGGVASGIVAGLRAARAVATQDEAALMNEIKGILDRVSSMEYIDELDGPRKEKVLDWVAKTLPKLLGEFFIKDEADAASFLLRVALKLTLPPTASDSAQEKLAEAILDGSKDLETGQYDMHEAMNFLNQLVEGYTSFIDQLSGTDSPMIKAIADSMGEDVAEGLQTLLGKLNAPFFAPMLTALKGVRSKLLERGGQVADQLTIRQADAEPDEGGKFPTRKVTDGAKSINAWVERSRKDAGSTDATVDIFSDDVLASEQFMEPFTFGNDPASQHSARNAQRMLVYMDSRGSVKGMLVTDTELDSYGAMIKDGTLKNAYFMDTDGKIDPKYLPPTCEEGVLPTGDAALGKIQAECPRFALCMRIYNGSVSPDVLEANPTMQDIFQRDIVADPTKKAAVTAFLDAKASDATWIDRMPMPIAA